MGMGNICCQMKKATEEKRETELIDDTHVEKIFSNSIVTTFLLSKSDETA
jgi:hypothetical protein